MTDIPNAQDDLDVEGYTSCLADADAVPKNVILGPTNPSEPGWNRAHLAELPLNRCPALLSLTKPFTGKTYSRKRRQEKISEPSQDGNNGEFPRGTSNASEGPAGPGTSPRPESMEDAAEAAPRAGPSAQRRSAPLSQMHLDLGQANFACTTCSICGMVYAQGEAADEKLHTTFHRNFLQGIRFQGWQNERVVLHDGLRGRVIMVLPHDHPSQQKRVKEICTFVEGQLGLLPGWILAKPCKVFLYVTRNKRVGGFLVAEIITSANPVIASACAEEEVESSYKPPMSGQLHAGLPRPEEATQDESCVPSFSLAAQGANPSLPTSSPFPQLQSASCTGHASGNRTGSPQLPLGHPPGSPHVSGYADPSARPPRSPPENEYDCPIGRTPDFPHGGEYDHPIGASPFVPHMRGTCEIGHGTSSPSPHPSLALMQQPLGDIGADVDMPGVGPSPGPSANEATLSLLDRQTLNPGIPPIGPSTTDGALPAASGNCHNLDAGVPPQPLPSFPTACPILDAPDSATPAHPFPPSRPPHLPFAAPMPPENTATRTPHEDATSIGAGAHSVHATDTPACPLVAFRRPANHSGLHLSSGGIQKVKAGPLGKPARMSYAGVTRKGPVWAAPEARGRGPSAAGMPVMDTPLTRWLTGGRPRCTGESTPRGDNRPTASAPAVQRTPSGAPFGSQLPYSPCPASEPAGRVVVDSFAQTSDVAQPFSSRSSFPATEAHQPRPCATPINLQGEDCSRSPFSPVEAYPPSSRATPLDLQGKEDPGNIRGETSTQGPNRCGVSAPGERSGAEGSSRPLPGCQPSAGSPMHVHSTSAGPLPHDIMSTASVQASHAGDTNGRQAPAVPSRGAQENVSARLTWPPPTRDAGCGPCVSEGSALVADGGNDALAAARHLLAGGIGESTASDGAECGGVGLEPLPGGGPVVARGKACPRPAEAGGALLVGRETREAHLGIRVVLVSAELRRQGVARKLLDVARCNCTTGYIVPKSKIAFSQPTPDGRKLAAAYTGTNQFLVYS